VSSHLSTAVKLPVRPPNPRPHQVMVLSLFPLCKPGWELPWCNRSSGRSAKALPRIPRGPAERQLLVASVDSELVETARYADPDETGFFSLPTRRGNGKYTPLCTRPDRTTTSGIGVPHLWAVGGRGPMFSTQTRLHLV